MKQFSRITLSLAATLVAGVQAADRVPASADMLTSQGIAASQNGVEMTSVNSRTLANGMTVTRYQQMHQGVPVWGQTVTQTGQGIAADVSGDALTGLAAEVPSVIPSIKVTNAIDQAMTQSVVQRNQQGISAGALSVEALKLAAKNQDHELYIHVDEQDQTRLAYLISWVEYGDEPSRPFYFIDAHTGAVLEHWDGIAHQEATGPGGNEKPASMSTVPIIRRWTSTTTAECRPTMSRRSIWVAPPVAAMCFPSPARTTKTVTPTVPIHR